MTLDHQSRALGLRELILGPSVASQSPAVILDVSASYSSRTGKSGQCLIGSSGCCGSLRSPAGVGTGSGGGLISVPPGLAGYLNRPVRHGLRSLENLTPIFDR